jgi:hypothetical protein
MFDNASPMYERRVAKSAGSLQKLSEVAGRARPVSLAAEQLLPVLPAFESILPDGLQRGQTVVVEGETGASSLALALTAGASKAGSWAAAVGTPSLGVGAAAEMGLVVERLLLVATPAQPLWPTVVAALIDAFDLVLVDWPGVPANFARRLAHRARERRSILVAVTSSGNFSVWREVADLRFSVTQARWQGLEWGHGRLASRLALVEMGGRRSARAQRVALWLPGPLGGVEVAATEAFEQRPAVISNVG